MTALAQHRRRVRLALAPVHRSPTSVSVRVNETWPEYRSATPRQGGIGNGPTDHLLENPAQRRIEGAHDIGNRIGRRPLPPGDRALANDPVLGDLDQLYMDDNRDKRRFSGRIVDRREIVDVGIEDK